MEYAFDKWRGWSGTCSTCKYIARQKNQVAHYIAHDPNFINIRHNSTAYFYFILLKWMYYIYWNMHLTTNLIRTVGDCPAGSMGWTLFLKQYINNGPFGDSNGYSCGKALQYERFRIWSALACVWVFQKKQYINNVFWVLLFYA